MCEHERRDQRGEEQRVRLEEERHGDAQAGEDVVDAEAERPEEPALPDGVAVAEQQHRCEQDVVDEHEGTCGSQGDDAHAQVTVSAQVPDRVRGERREHVVRDVEALDVPGEALLQPRGDEEDDGERDEQLGWEHERAGDDEGRAGVEAVVAADADPEERRCGSQRGEHGERDPVGCGWRRLREGDGRDRRNGSPDQHHQRVRVGTGREPDDAARSPARRRRSGGNAHRLFH